MTSRTTYVALLLAAALTAGCSASTDAAPPEHAGHQQTAASAPAVDHEDHAAGHGGHLSAGALDSMLLTEADLPEGYRAGGGHHHGDPDGEAPELTTACEPIGWLVGDHPALQSEHPHARTTFGKGHYGPQITETVIDFGDPATAKAAYADVVAAEDCERYVQSTAQVGANVYAVAAADGGPDGTTLRLDAVSDDFDGLHWDVWVTRQDSLLVSVALRTALGGDAEDLGPAVEAALSRLRPVS